MVVVDNGSESLKVGVANELVFSPSKNVHNFVAVVVKGEGLSLVFIGYEIILVQVPKLHNFILEVVSEVT